MRDDELAVAVDFAALILKAPEGAVEPREPPEPDARVRLADGTTVGVEVTSFFDTHERQAGHQERAFLAEVNKAILQFAPPLELRFRLVMQEDGGEVIHQPAPGMEHSPALARWLDGLFVERSPHSPHETVVLNQRQLPRPPVGLFPQGAEVQALARDLASYGKRLNDNDFAKIPEDVPGVWPPTHHVVTSRFKALRQDRQKGGWAHPSLDKKLTDPGKYALEGLACTHLVIHNYAAWSDIAQRLWHPFSHHREAILGHLAARAAARTVGHFEEIWFLDYSYRMGGLVAYRLGTGVALRVGEWVSRASAL